MIPGVHARRNRKTWTPCYECKFYSPLQETNNGTVEDSDYCLVGIECEDLPYDMEPGDCCEGCNYNKSDLLLQQKKIDDYWRKYWDDYYSMPYDDE